MDLRERSPAAQLAAVAVIATGDVEFDIYLRDLPTEYTYYWAANDNVTCADVP